MKVWPDSSPPAAGGAARLAEPQAKLVAAGWALGNTLAPRPTPNPSRRREGSKRRATILLHVIARGKIARSPEAELVARYEKRIAWPVKLTELPETGGRIPDPQTPFRTVLLDEKGKDLSSEKFAEVLEKWRDGGMRECRFVLGAADGHSQQERDEADLLLAFGKATWPHLLARAMLMEQLFRATSILAGHPYHRSG